ncbi:unnamed protein product [Closterium sp. NIES-65]|nr:unnamed protein product [Closterium sp. NIES-65]
MQSPVGMLHLSVVHMMLPSLPLSLSLPLTQSHSLPPPFSLLPSRGNHWAGLRSALTPMFHRSTHLHSFLSGMHRSVLHMLLLPLWDATQTRAGTQEEGGRERRGGSGAQEVGGTEGGRGEERENQKGGRGEEREKEQREGGGSEKGWVEVDLMGMFEAVGLASIGAACFGDDLWFQQDSADTHTAPHTAALHTAAPHTAALASIGAACFGEDLWFQQDRTATLTAATADTGANKQAGAKLGAHSSTTEPAPPHTTLPPHTAAHSTALHTAAPHTASLARAYGANEQAGAKLGALSSLLLALSPACLHPWAHALLGVLPGSTVGAARERHRELMLEWKLLLVALSPPCLHPWVHALLGVLPGSTVGAARKRHRELILEWKVRGLRQHLATKVFSAVPRGTTFSLCPWVHALLGVLPGSTVGAARKRHRELMLEWKVRGLRQHLATKVFSAVPRGTTFSLCPWVHALLGVLPGSTVGAARERHRELMLEWKRKAQGQDCIRLPSDPCGLLGAGVEAHHPPWLYSDCPPDPLPSPLPSSFRDKGTGARLADSDLPLILFGLLGAGVGTTSSTLAFAVHMLTQHPDVSRKLQAEIDRYFEEREQAGEVKGEGKGEEEGEGEGEGEEEGEGKGERGPGEIGRRRFDDSPPVFKNRSLFKGLEVLKYLDMVVKETLRLYPAAPIAARLPVHATTLAGYHIPANTPVVVPIFAAHRCPDFFPRPLSFLPERFGTAGGSAVLHLMVVWHLIRLLSHRTSHLTPPTLFSPPTSTPRRPAHLIVVWPVRSVGGFHLPLPVPAPKD